VEDIAIDGQGMVHAPTEPGLGYGIDWDLVQRAYITTYESRTVGNPFFAGIPPWRNSRRRA